MKAKRSSVRVESETVFGHVTDFEIKTESDGERIKITLKTVPPALHYDREARVLRSYPPPRYPWADLR